MRERAGRGLVTQFSCACPATAIQAIGAERSRFIKRRRSRARQRGIILRERLVERDSAKCCNRPGDCAIKGASRQKLDANGVSGFEAKRTIELDLATRDVVQVHALQSALRMQDRMPWRTALAWLLGRGSSGGLLQTRLVFHLIQPVKFALEGHCHKTLAAGLCAKATVYWI